MVQEVQWPQEVFQILGTLCARDDSLKFILQAHWVWCRVTGGEQNTELYEVVSVTVLSLVATHFKSDAWLHCAVGVPVLFKRCSDVYCVSSRCLDVLYPWQCWAARGLSSAWLALTEKAPQAQKTPDGFHGESSAGSSSGRHGGQRAPAAWGRHRLSSLWPTVALLSVQAKECPPSGALQMCPQMAFHTSGWWESLFLSLWSITRQLPFLDLRKRKQAGMDLCPYVLELIYVQRSLTACSGLLGILAQLLRCAVQYHGAQAPNFEVVTVSVRGVRRNKYFILCCGFQSL